MTRHKRLRQIGNIGRFVAEATAMHGVLIGYQQRLRTDSVHYRALLELHDALLKTIRDVTGEDVPWTRTPAEKIP